MTLKQEILTINKHTEKIKGITEEIKEMSRPKYNCWCGHSDNNVYNFNNHKHIISQKEWRQKVEIETIAKIIAVNAVDWESYRGKALKVIEYYKNKEKT